MNDNPEISIIIPTYNHAHLIKRCLSSLIDQTISNWEAIVINNFSKDNTIEVVEAFCDKRIRLINFNNNGIIGASRNKGIELARGNYVAFLDSDDFWYRKKLEISLRYLKNADVVYHALDIYTQKGKRPFRKLRSRHVKSPVFVDLMTNGNAINNSSVIVKKKLIEDVGGFGEDELLVAMEDCDLWLRISRVTERFVYIPQKLGGYWLGGGNVTSASESYIVKLNSLYDRHVKFLNVEDRKQAELYKCYLVGRLKQKLGQLDEAKNYFKLSNKAKNIKIKLKSMLQYSILNLIK